jgi:hypothetical protein
MVCKGVIKVRLTELVTATIVTGVHLPTRVPLDVLITYCHTNRVTSVSVSCKFVVTSLLSLNLLELHDYDF